MRLAKAIKGETQLVAQVDYSIETWSNLAQAMDGVIQTLDHAHHIMAVEPQQAEFLSKHGKRKPNDDEWRDYWLGHILDWRGIEDGGKPVEFDLDLLRILWKRDAQFRAWLMTECQRLDRFRK